MILLYFLIGLIIAAIGAAPLGASNIAVIATTNKGSLSTGMKVAYGAGFGEVLLAFMALCYSRMISEFFIMNAWLQISFITLFFIIGVFFLLPSRFQKLRSKQKTLPTSKSSSKFLTGFLLALANPPVLLFWILAISLVQKYLISVSDMSPFLILLLFFAGIYLGKVGVLYGYGVLSSRVKQRGGNRPKFYKFMGIVLIALSLVQGVRFLFS